jgi:cbb3-type cytochrome oxidase subunit 1
VIRLAGGTLFLVGMLLMAWNVMKTIRQGRPTPVRIPAPGATAPGLAGVVAAAAAATA